jgi:hypothetical protein
MEHVRLVGQRRAVRDDRSPDRLPADAVLRDRLIVFAASSARLRRARSVVDARDRMCSLVPVQICFGLDEPPHPIDPHLRRSPTAKITHVDHGADQAAERATTDRKPVVRPLASTVLQLAVVFRAASSTKPGKPNIAVAAVPSWCTWGPSFTS